MIALGLAQREPLDNRSQIVRPPLRRRRGVTLVRTGAEHGRLGAPSSLSAELSDDRTAQELCGMEYFRYSAIAHASVVLRVHTLMRQQ
jgi:hypothetical protein